MIDRTEVASLLELAEMADKCKACGAGPKDQCRRAHESPTNKLRASAPRLAQLLREAVAELDGMHRVFFVTLAELREMVRVASDYEAAVDEPDRRPETEAEFIFHRLPAGTFPDGEPQLAGIYMADAEELGEGVMPVCVYGELE